MRKNTAKGQITPAAAMAQGWAKAIRAKTISPKNVVQGILLSEQPAVAAYMVLEVHRFLDPDEGEDFRNAVEQFAASVTPAK